ncbi:MAG: hydrogenase maturation nickel metallochaperone HypA [Chitinophagales bacterium]|nr:hydrogenase maturation nickel metallochaperone HypA [Chitinophagales bacterium]
MHELSIANSVLSIAEKAAPAANDGTVSAVNLQIGALSGIETDALTFAFSVIREDTLLKHAVLNIEIIPGEAACLQCALVFAIEGYSSACPQCGSNAIRIQKGKELKVISLTVEE